MYIIEKVYDPNGKTLHIDPHDLISLLTILNSNEDIEIGIKAWLFNEPKYYTTKVDRHLLEVAINKVLDNLNLQLEMAIYERNQYQKMLNVSGYSHIEKIVITAQTQNNLYVIDNGVPGVLTVFAKYYIHKSSYDSIDELRNLAKVIGWASGMHTVLAAILIDTITVERIPSTANDSEILEILQPLLDTIENIAQIGKDDKINQLSTAFRDIEALYQDYNEIIQKHKEFENKLSQLKQYVTGLATSLGIDKFDYVGSTQKVKMYSVSQKYFDDKALAKEMPEVYSKYLKERSYKVLKVF
jgi:flagellar biosynthesis chaperone FliJ